MRKARYSALHLWCPSRPCVGGVVSRSVVALAAVAVATAGCASMRGGVEGDFGRAALQIGSAAVSSRLSLTMFADGRNTVAATDTALGDMLEEVDQAASSTADRAVESSDQAHLRAEVLQWAEIVLDDIVRGRDIVAGIGPATELPAVATTLGEAGNRLQALGEELEGAG
ncbi:hypothetical protein ACFYSW_27485 [Rhodococcus aetherivorans]|uniref:hypothetical protein n=1 Tax=Rhodococcus aetherivorans TaxID=191292 RepID=UPI0036CD9C6C